MGRCGDGGLRQSLPPGRALLSPCHPSQSDAERGHGGGRCPPGSHSWWKGDGAPLGCTPRPAGTGVGPPLSSIPPRCSSTLLHPPSPAGSRQVPAGSPRSHASLSPSPGYYYDLDDSCDDSDEEEVRAHLRCVAEQPPLKLDTSSEVRPPAPLPRLWGAQGWAEDEDGHGDQSGGDPALLSPRRRPRSWSSCSSSASPRSSRRRNC